MEVSGRFRIRAESVESEAGTDTIPTTVQPKNPASDYHDIT